MCCYLFLSLTPDDGDTADEPKHLAEHIGAFMGRPVSNNSAVFASCFLVNTQACVADAREQRGG